MIPSQNCSTYQERGSWPKVSMTGSVQATIWRLALFSGTGSTDAEPTDAVPTSGGTTSTPRRGELVGETGLEVKVVMEGRSSIECGWSRHHRPEVLLGTLPPSLPRCSRIFAALIVGPPRRPGKRTLPSWYDGLALWGGSR